MGLDVTAYGRVELIDVTDDIEGYEDRYYYREAELGFKTAFVRGTQDFPERMPPIVGGVYRINGEDYGFNAGGYMGYNRWRSQLSQIAPYPFRELVYFSDREGVIGTDVCKRLAAAFAEHQPQADQHEDARFKEKYTDWRKAFDIAADGGYVWFH
jgi:hypothetical protein